MYPYDSIIYTILSTWQPLTDLIAQRMYPVIVPPIAPGQAPENYILNQFPALVYTKSINPIDTKGTTADRVKVESVSIAIHLIAQASLGNTINDIASAVRDALIARSNVIIAGHLVSNINFIGQDHEQFDDSTELITLSQLYNVHINKT